MRHLSIFLTALILLGSCGADDSNPEHPPAHPEPADFIEVPDIDDKGDSVPAVFEAGLIVTDDFYSDAEMVDADTLQEFFETSPYGTRSWMADELIDGRRVADIIVEASQASNVNPVMLLVRLQVEQGLVSKTVRPSQRKIDRALGCGCHDGEACASSFRGFDRQMACGAETHRKLFGDSEAGNGTWVKGESRATLDPLRIKPKNHASAALYAYTPWVLRGSGGNWLVWNITRKFVRHLETEGLIASQTTPFIGQPCGSHEECKFEVDGEMGFCFEYLNANTEESGFCTLTCSGACPDKAGAATTFCIDSGVQGVGICASKPGAENQQCLAIPGTRIEERQRFTESADSTVANVCAPDTI